MKRLNFVLSTAALMFPLTQALVSGPASAAADSNVTGQMIVNKAEQYLGDKYAYTGSTPKTGFSCIGFVYYVFQSMGIDMPGNLSSAMATYPHVTESDLEPGDIIFFKNTWWKGLSHVAIYIGNGQIVHAENPQNGVNITQLRNDPSEGNYYQHHYLQAERPLEGESPVTGGGTGSQSVRDRFRAVVDVAYLNLRTGPSLDDGIITSLQKGTDLKVKREEDGWYKVHVAGHHEKGWVIQGGLARHSSTTTPRTTHTRTKQTGSVLIGDLHLREGPSTADTIVATLSKGTTVRVLGESNGWDKIAWDNVKGWSIAWGVKLNSTRTKGPAKKPVKRGQGASTSKNSHTVVPGIRIHSGPSLNDTIVGYTESGVQVEVLATRKTFAKVKTISTPAVVGWMVKSYIDGLKTGHTHHTKPVPHLTSTGTVLSPAHVRTGPSLSDLVINTLHSGTKVAILRVEPKWYRIRCSVDGSKTIGYIWRPLVVAG
jgi:uncharacterized protein YgiM (DUF1202 family)